VLTDDDLRTSDHRPATIQVWRLLCQPPDAADTQTAAQAGFDESTHRGADATLEGSNGVSCSGPRASRAAEWFARLSNTGAPPEPDDSTTCDAEVRARHSAWHRGS